MISNNVVFWQVYTQTSLCSKYYAPEYTESCPKASDSTTNQLLQIYHTFCNAVDRGKELRAVFATLVRLSTGYGIEDFSTNYQATDKIIINSLSSTR